MENNRHTLINVEDVLFKDSVQSGIPPGNPPLSSESPEVFIDPEPLDSSQNRLEEESPDFNLSQDLEASDEPEAIDVIQEEFVGLSQEAVDVTQEVTDVVQEGPGEELQEVKREQVSSDSLQDSEEQTPCSSQDIQVSDVQPSLAKPQEIPNNQESLDDMQQEETLDRLDDSSQDVEVSNDQMEDTEDVSAGLIFPTINTSAEFLEAHQDDEDPQDGDQVFEDIDKIPDRMAFKIGEVAFLTGIKSHVLRYWESEFEALRPKKANNRRMYSQKDIKTILLIKRLLYKDKYSIEGAKKALKTLQSEIKEQRKTMLLSYRQKEAITAVKNLIHLISSLKKKYRL